jgi:hypothetical protein
LECKRPGLAIREQINHLLFVLGIQSELKEAGIGGQEEVLIVAGARALGLTVVFRASSAFDSSLAVGL